MDASLDIWIRRAEDTWLEALHDHAALLFMDADLPSHDHSHHLRVWNLCKSILREIHSLYRGMDQSLVDGVLIAALFHDLGMTLSFREDHGSLSRKICEQWFRDSGRDLPGRFDEVLRAIELHDKKDEQIYGSFEPGSTPHILAILSVADDLEALGTIGIYRYAEIYLIRGIPLEDLGSRILNNVRNRFGRLEKACRLCPSLLEKHRKEYEKLCEFYENYNRQWKDHPRPDRADSGPLGVINYIRTQGPHTVDSGRAGEETNTFLSNLNHELEQARL